MAVGDIRGVPNQYVLLLDGEDRSAEVTSATLGKASRAAQTFAEFRDGGPFALRMGVVQNFATATVWEKCVNHAGDSVTGALLPQGNTAGKPKFSFTATVAAPTSEEHVGGEGGAVDADSPTIETEWLLAAKWVQSTV